MAKVPERDENDIVASTTWNVYTTATETCHWTHYSELQNPTPFFKPGVSSGKWDHRKENQLVRHTEKMENYSDTFAGKVGSFPVKQNFVVPFTV